MGPKTAVKVPEKVVSKDETFIFYTELKSNDVVEKIAINSSCRVDIVADYARRQFLKYCTEKLAALTAANCEDETLIQNLKEFQSVLQKCTTSDIVFQDGQGVNITCTEDTGKSGLTVFTPLSTYKLGVTKEDKSVFIFAK